MVATRRRKVYQEGVPCTTQRTLLSSVPQPLTVTFGVNPEDQILGIVQSKGKVFLADLPNSLKRTSKWTLSLEKQGLLERVQVKDKGGTRLLLISKGPGTEQTVPPVRMRM